LSQIDTNGVFNRIQSQLTTLPSWLVSDTDIYTNVQEEINQLLTISDVGTYLGNIIGGISSTLIGIFSVLFISFFLLKDGQIINQIITSLSPEKYLNKVKTIVVETKDLLSRYFIGVLVQVTVVVLVITIGLSIAGVKNALLIGVIAGVFNIIPYIGPLMGAGIGLLLAATSQLETAPDMALSGFLLSALIPFVVAQLLDNFVLQPVIFSKSVKAHPLEIFMVILAAGSLAGIVGMIIAVPTYSFIRIIAKEFFYGYKIVQGLTKDL
jgi:predicted PurR-regulated permease PerM